MGRLIPVSSWVGVPLALSLSKDDVCSWFDTLTTSREMRQRNCSSD